MDVCLTYFESTWHCFKNIFIIQSFVFLKNESSWTGSTMFNLCQTIANCGCYWNVLYIKNIKFNLDNLKKRHLGNLLQSSFIEIMWPYLYQIHFLDTALKAKFNPSLAAVLLFSSVTYPFFCYLLSHFPLFKLLCLLVVWKKGLQY